MHPPLSWSAICMALLLLGTGAIRAQGAAPPAQEQNNVTQKEPLFSRHVVPLLSRLGCNAGNCHGAVQGQNGFRLTLFGAAPALDHDRLLRDQLGRRINLAEPEKSLVLLKASGRTPHEGGTRAAPGSPEYAVLRNWIAGGARLDRLQASEVKSLTVTPAAHTAKAGENYALRVQATFADGSSEDVTALCTFESADKNVAEVDSTGRVTVAGIGDAPLIVRYRSQPVMASVLAPAQTPGAFPAVAANNFIDGHVLDKLRRLNIHPSEVCDDATFLRRACLDTTGELPTPDEVRAFLADKNPNKRAKKIDELLDRPGYAALWATRFSDLLKVSGYNGNYALSEPVESRRVYEWLRARFKENTPYDQLVERILTATSREGRSQEEWLQEVMALAEENARRTPDLDVYAHRKTLDLYWQREGATGVKGTLQVAHAFLGLRLECAQCHRHPHDIWQQDDLLSFANFFMAVKGAGYPDAKALPPQFAEMMKKGPNDAKQLREQAKKLTDKLKDKGLPAEEADKLKVEAASLEMKARTMENGPKRFGTEVFTSDRTTPASVSSPLGTQKSEQHRLLGAAQSSRPAKGEDPRQMVVDWLKQADNPYFARAIANRIWAHYFGRGIVDPADQLSPLNPPSHPELLAALADGFVKSKYDLKWLHRAVLNSRTYQLSCQPNDTNKSDRRNYAYFYFRRLPAEVLVDAINHATGGSEQYPAELCLPANARAIEVAGVTGMGNERASMAFAFQVFGRPLRNPSIQCDCERDTGATMVQTLYLANHPAVREKINKPEGRLAQIVKGHADDGRRIEELYLWTLSRPPTRAEAQTCLEYIKDSPSPQKGLEDVLWSLLNTRAFILNH